MSKHAALSINDVTDLLCDWRSEERTIVVAFFSNPQITQSWFMVRARSLKLVKRTVELGGPGGLAFFSLEGATVSPTDGPLLHATREFIDRVKPLIPAASTMIELLLPGGSVLVLWDAPPERSAAPSMKSGSPGSQSSRK